MKIFPVVLCFLFIAGCRKKETAPGESVYDRIARVRAFTFVNSDSVLYYKAELQKIADPEIPLHHALLSFADALYNETAGVHRKALADFEEAIPLFERAKNDSFVAACLLGKGNCYKLTGNVDSAVYYYQAALHSYEKLHNSFFVTVSLVDLAETYEENNDIENSAKYLALGKANEAYGSKIYVSILHLQANLYGMKDQTDSALLTDRTGIALAQQYHYPDKLSSFYDNTAQCFLKLKRYDSADYYYRNCIRADSLNGRLQLVADTYTQLVNLYAAEKEGNKMNAAAAYALKLCDSTQYLRGKYAVYQGLDNYYSSSKDLFKAGEAKDSLLSIYKRLTGEETEARTAQYNVEFETARKEELIHTQEAGLRRGRGITILLTMLAASLLVTLIALYRNYRTSKRIAVNCAIQEQKDINTREVFESEQAERIRIARDLHDSIGQKLSVLKMYITGEEDQQKRSPALLDETIQEIRNISHNLLPEELNFGLLKAIESDTGKLQETGKFRVTTGIAGKENFPLIPLPVSLNVLMVFRELLSNLVKHSGAEEIDIKISATEHLLSLIIKDDGSGVNKKLIAESRGIGWKNIFTRINMLKGSIDIADNEPSGNIITLQIPLPDGRN